MNYDLGIDLHIKKGFINCALSLLYTWAILVPFKNSISGQNMTSFRALAIDYILRKFDKFAP
jgi:hypothetical protein